MISYICNKYQYLMGLDATKPAFWVSEKSPQKPVSSVAETSSKIDISPVASLDVILSTDAQAGLHFYCSQTAKQVFWLQGPNAKKALPSIQLFIVLSIDVQTF